MANLANQSISSTYDGLIKTSSDNQVPASGVQLLEDGTGNSLALSIGRANNGVTVTGTVNATSFIKSGGTSSQFLKADGSIDSSTYLTSAPVTSVNTQTGAVSLSLSNLADVASTSPTDGQVLTYDTTNGWQPETPSGGGTIDGNGTTNYISKWSDSNTLTDSIISDNGTAVNIGGNLTFPNGNGIDFSASAGGGASSSLLDDYEEGTWTMGISFGGASVGVTYLRNAGTYTKIGRQVTVTAYLTLSNKGSSTGNARITGLPFSVANNNSFLAAASLGWVRDISFADIIFAYGLINTTEIDIYESTNAGVISAIDNTNFANTSEIIFTMTYFTS